jgi:hypothetical protein
VTATASSLLTVVKVELLEGLDLRVAAPLDPLG